MTYKDVLNFILQSPNVMYKNKNTDRSKQIISNNIMDIVDIFGKDISFTVDDNVNYFTVETEIPLNTMDTYIIKLRETTTTITLHETVTLSNPKLSSGKLRIAAHEVNKTIRRPIKVTTNLKDVLTKMKGDIDGQK